MAHGRRGNVVRGLGVIALVALLVGCANERRGTGAPEFFGTWVGMGDASQQLTLTPDGRASTVSLPQTSDPACDLDTAPRVTGSGTWFIDDRNFMVIALNQGDIYVVPSGRFGVPDWESIWVSVCRGDQADGKWIEMVGGNRDWTADGVKEKP